MLWLDKGDKGSKFFFNILKQKQCKERIDKIWVDGKEIDADEEILNLFNKFYKQLFSSEDSPSSKVARVKCKDLIPKLVSPNEVISLCRPFSVEEIIRAINSLHNDKAPGRDGLTIEFYKANISWIANDLLEIYNEAIKTKTMGININRGLIKLIPKEGDKALTKN